MLKFLKNLFGGNADALNEALAKNAVVIDVRTPAEYQQGHVKGSKNIPLNEISKKVEMIKKWNKPVITVCRSGARSASAKNMLQSNGIEVVNGGPWTSVNRLVS